MNRDRTPRPVPDRRRRRAATGAALCILVGLPLAAFELAPTAHADEPPGSNLAGLGASAFASGVQVAPLTPGIVGAGNLSEGNLFEVAIPYAGAATSTGPSNSGVASPLYPGPTAASAGNALGTFGFPPQLAQNLNYPVLAQSAYPAQVSIGTSGTYAPPWGSAAGIGTAQSNSGPAGTTSTASASANALPAGVLTVASSTSKAATVVKASSIASSSHTEIGTVELMGGAVVISGITSDASAQSDGSTGTHSDDLRIGSVTVGGQKAWIGPDGIHLASGTQGNGLAAVANQVLSALQQAGITVKTLAPTNQDDGALGSVTSGVVQITFIDHNIPNPNGQVPVSSVGIAVDLGLASASADATALPPLGQLGSFGPSSSGGGNPVSTGSAISPATQQPIGSPTVATGPGPVSSGLPSPTGTAASVPSSASPSGQVAGPPPTGLSNPQPAAVLGRPVTVGWMVAAVLLSIMLSGPLLGYANWQLLRGRRT